jgi:hypothetical protein
MFAVIGKMSPVCSTRYLPVIESRVESAPTGVMTKRSQKGGFVLVALRSVVTRTPVSWLADAIVYDESVSTRCAVP